MLVIAYISMMSIIYSMYPYLGNHSFTCIYMWKWSHLIYLFNCYAPVSAFGSCFISSNFPLYSQPNPMAANESMHCTGDSIYSALFVNPLTSLECSCIFLLTRTNEYISAAIYSDYSSPVTITEIETNLVLHLLNTKKANVVAKAHSIKATKKNVVMKANY